jgi:hypothetical protein
MLALATFTFLAAASLLACSAFDASDDPAGATPAGDGSAPASEAGAGDEASARDDAMTATDGPPAPLEPFTFFSPSVSISAEPSEYTIGFLQENLDVHASYGATVVAADAGSYALTLHSVANGTTIHWQPLAGGPVHVQSVVVDPSLKAAAGYRVDQVSFLSPQVPGPVIRALPGQVLQLDARCTMWDSAADTTAIRSVVVGFDGEPSTGCIAEGRPAVYPGSVSYGPYPITTPQAKGQHVVRLGSAAGKLCNVAFGTVLDGPSIAVIVVE